MGSNTFISSALDFPFLTLDTNFLTGLFVVLVPIAFCQVDCIKLCVRFEACGLPLSIRLEFDELETSAIEFDDLLSLGGVAVGVRLGSFFDGCRVFPLFEQEMSTT
jgi:hypothetical protein